MTSLHEIQETFALLDDWEDRYAYVIDLGKNLAPYPEDKRDDAHIVKGCTARVWMDLYVDGGCIHIVADSDAHIVKGLIALVLAVYNGQEIDHARDINMEQIFEDLGLAEHLLPNRRNGFFAMVGVIKQACGA